jgi:hypothetical protein
VQQGARHGRLRSDSASGLAVGSPASHPATLAAAGCVQLVRGHGFQQVTPAQVVGPTAGLVGLPSASRTPSHASSQLPHDDGTSVGASPSPTAGSGALCKAVHSRAVAAAHRGCRQVLRGCGRRSRYRHTAATAAGAFRHEAMSASGTSDDDLAVAGRVRRPCSRTGAAQNDRLAEAGRVRRLPPSTGAAQNEQASLVSARERLGVTPGAGAESNRERPFAGGPLHG